MGGSSLDVPNNIWISRQNAKQNQVTKAQHYWTESMGCAMLARFIPWKTHAFSSFSDSTFAAAPKWTQSAAEHTVQRPSTAEQDTRGKRSGIRREKVGDWARPDGSRFLSLADIWQSSAVRWVKFINCAICHCVIVECGGMGVIVVWW